MPLKLTLEPQEWFMVGSTKVINIWSEAAKLRIEGAAPILRQTHTMGEQDANTTLKRTYFSVQKLYLGIASDTDEYRRCAAILLLEYPSASEVVQIADREVAQGCYYGALREYRKLFNLSTCFETLPGGSAFDQTVLIA